VKKYTLTFRTKDVKAKPIVFDGITRVRYSEATGDTDIPNNLLDAHDYKLDCAGTYHFYSDNESRGSIIANAAIAVNIDEEMLLDFGSIS